MTKPTATYLQLSTIKKIAMHLTSTQGVDDVVSRAMDALGTGAWAGNRDEMATVVQNKGFDKRYDLNGDLTVNPADQALAANFGMPQSATPPASTVLQTILDDMTLPHDGPICGVAGFDWEHKAAIQKAQSTGIAAMTGWGWAQHYCGSDQNANVRVHVRNRKTWLWDGSTYRLVQSGAITWRAVMNTQTNAFSSGNDDWRDEGNGEYSFVIPPDTAVHWAGPNNGIPAGNYWIICMAEYRIEGPDAATAQIMGECGADWRNPNPVGAVVGRAKKLDTNWRLCTATTFRPTVAPVYP